MREHRWVPRGAVFSYCAGCRRLLASGLEGPVAYLAKARRDYGGDVTFSDDCDEEAIRKVLES